jgi:hypothetical protein
MKKAKIKHFIVLLGVCSMTLISCKKPTSNYTVRNTGLTSGVASMQSASVNVQTFGTQPAAGSGSGTNTGGVQQQIVHVPAPFPVRECYLYVYIETCTTPQVGDDRLLPSPKEINESLSDGAFIVKPAPYESANYYCETSAGSMYLSNNIEGLLLQPLPYNPQGPAQPQGGAQGKATYSKVDCDELDKKMGNPQPAGNPTGIPGIPSI